ncbi:hypothetical protein [Tumebacillus permanentifrigoris]|uniref:Uncharacterized protein n=1 Tax=Tumebacillus permanentifrigoris TaxID=378543 RepID=A0A316D6I2_9BACL|nr:hypothetical protein [Tumebacillus permanentifrigoris]PWK10204.1 hypothetical protein C7459_11225 [Tumebacillus permanentifrigoris]
MKHLTQVLPEDKISFERALEGLAGGSLTINRYVAEFTREGIDDGLYATKGLLLTMLSNLDHALLLLDRKVTADKHHARGFGAGNETGFAGGYEQGVAETLRGNPHLQTQAAQIAMGHTFDLLAKNGGNVIMFNPGGTRHDHRR